MKVRISMEAINWRELRGINASCKEKTFMKAIEIWLLKPHVVNRRLAGAVVLHRTHTNNARILRLVEQFSSSKSGDEFSATTFETSKEDYLNVSCCEISTAKEIPSKNDGIEGVEDCGLHSCDGNLRFELCVRKLIPRQSGQGTTEETMNEVIIIDHKESTATFVPLQDTSLNVDRGCRNNRFRTAYRISFSSQAPRISLHISEDYQEPTSPAIAVTCPTIAWLQDRLLPKIAKWASEVSADAPVRSSQALVSMERYSTLYGELKKKYGAKFVKIWPENTDPLKFVYEDVAIATYLIVLWEQERVEKGLVSLQSFVDLGCGNGLLVHILNSEGYPGKGIDLRRRTIWDLYGPGTNLEECSITPSDDFLFPDCDWLIGNHSDELTPWIPVMAARSSYSTRYFVLPCCFHDFEVKFMRSAQTKTQYRAYLDFVEEVGRVCGFNVQEDTMRIPSTKRICQIGSHRNYKPEESVDIHKQITNYIASRRPHRTSPTHKKELKPTRTNSASTSTSTSECVTDADDEINGTGVLTYQTQCSAVECKHQSTLQGTGRAGDELSSPVPSVKWAPRFQPREKIEPVRNCAKVDYDLKQRIVNEVAHTILGKEGVDCSDNFRGSKEKKLWRRGGSLTFAEIVELFDSDTLKQLKSECGGLKTLLKNSHQVFQVSSDRVEIRDWSVRAPNQRTHSKKPKRNNTKKAQTIKTRLCWFHDNHPDGCPRLANECQFAHGAEELKELSIPSR